VYSQLYVSMMLVEQQNQSVQELEKKNAKRAIYYADLQDLEKENALKEDVVTL